MSKRIVIIDGNSMINRAYYAMRNPMITKDGVYTQGVYGFINMLNKIEEDYSPEYLAVAWDTKTPTFRHKAYDKYKAGRRKMPPELAMQIPIVKDILDAMHMMCLEKDGYEADDIIGTVARISEREGLAPLIITGDKDALQLATDITKILITRKGISEFDLYDKDKMIERYELTPEQFIDLKGLMGDQSDNIPGIAGIGEKTGIKLLKQFGSIENMLSKTDEIENVKLRTKVENGTEIAVKSRRLAEIHTKVPIKIDLENFKVVAPDYTKLIELYKKLEFNRFLRRLSDDSALETESAPVSIREYKDIVIKDVACLKKLDGIPACAETSIQVFGDGNHVLVPSINAISIIHDYRHYFISYTEDMKDDLIDILNNKHFRFIGHNLIDSYYPLFFRGLNDAETAFDTAVCEYVLDPSRSSYALKDLVFRDLGREIMDDERKPEGVQLDLLGEENEKLIKAGVEICDAVAGLKSIQEKKLQDNHMVALCREVEFPLISVLAAMEANGLCVDTKTLSDTGLRLKDEIDNLSSEIYEYAGHEFNINSPKQLGEVLFDELKLPAGKKTKNGYSTSADILERIRDKHPIIELVIAYRNISKLKSTYIDGLLPLVDKTGRVHAHFQQTVAATGRLSCTEPNLQNIPIRQETGRALRKSFVPTGDNIFIGADYSQIELRIMAHLSGDENLIGAFNRGDDIHAATASRVFDIPTDEVRSVDRSKAKAVNFGIIYGMSGFGLSDAIHVSRFEAEKYIDEYFRKHEAVKKYLDDQIDFCKENGYTLTICGRRRYIPEINSSAYMSRKMGERLAMNSPIQGSAADIIKKAMIDVNNELKQKKFKSRLILQIHDELIIDATADEADKVKELLIRNMEGAVKLSVSLTCDLSEGKTWYDMKD